MSARSTWKTLTQRFQDLLEDLVNGLGACPFPDPDLRLQFDLQLQQPLTNVQVAFVEYLLSVDVEFDRQGDSIDYVPLMGTLG